MRMHHRMLVLMFVVMCFSTYAEVGWCLTGFSSRQRNSNICPRVIVLTFIKHLPAHVFKHPIHHVQ